ncbi:hypothetical protein [Nonlabens tegetincola]|uniref:hypothetical protein n=1 Tax=Nonlabens tegetincola TaxID=323273 RepID=UPI000CF4E688|nr:hypothetical protein [Nonlabens tegetincola]MEE2801696.1 hypothetical protein [Bacteroidota bacterium]PQJ14062.1 hypothetical protein BST93_12475 [Nonlabens tegetincola]
MRKLIFILGSFLILSCNQDSSKQSDQTVLDEVTQSADYQRYVQAYNEYAACKRERPKITEDYISNKIDDKEFKRRIEVNSQTCAIKKDIFNKYYQLLEAQFDKELVVAHKIMPN